MAKAKRLPSGSWRCRVYSHTDSYGKKHYESFTAPTKQQAELMASKFANDTDRKKIDDITVQEAVERYIEANRSVLSPSTINGYKKDSKRFEPINHLKIKKITSRDLQLYISGLIEKGLSPKTVRNSYGLLRTVLTFSGIEQNFMVHLPSIPKKKKFAPENEQIKALLDNASPKMRIAICLAAFHSLRRGEISALKYKDLNGNTLYIHSDIVMGTDGWVHKEIPKTESSNRTIYLSDVELKMIGTGDSEDYIVDILPGTIGTNFYNLKKKVGIEMRFHDLRGYFASIAAALNISDTYLSHLGGWKEGSHVLKEYYQKPIVSINEGYAKKMNDYFESMTQNMTRIKKDG